MRIGVSLLLITILMLLGLLKHTEKKNRGLEIKILKLEEEKKVHWNNKTLVCDTAEGELVHINCGESFVNSAALCICTTSCLEDYSMTVSNSPPESCGFWHAQDNK